MRPVAGAVGGGDGLADCFGSIPRVGLMSAVEERIE